MPISLRKTALPILALAGATLASASSYRIDSYYDFAVDTTTYGSNAVIHDLEVAMRVGSSDGSYSDITSKTSYLQPGDSGTAYDFLDTKYLPYLGPNPAEPVVRDSLLYGVIDGLPGDVQGQHHLVFFMNPDAATNVQGVPYDDVFATSAQPYQFTEDSIINALMVVHRDDVSADSKAPYYDELYKFQDDVTRNANAGPNGTLGDIWFTPQEGFQIVSFSDGQTIGSGTNTVVTTFNPVPEPASFAALGVGALALLRRRRKASRV